MNMMSLPRPVCPYCQAQMRRWPLGQPVLACDTCRRPILRYLARPRARIFRLRPVYTVVHAVALVILFAAVATVAFGGLETRHVILAVAIPIAMFAASDIADGWLSWRTGVDRGWRKLRTGRVARAIGVARTAFGVAGVAVAVIGLLAYGELRQPTRPAAPSLAQQSTR